MRKKLLTNLVKCPPCCGIERIHSLLRHEFSQSLLVDMSSYGKLVLQGRQEESGLIVQSFMVVATFKSEVTQGEIRALIPQEQAQAKKLEDEGKIGVIKIAMPRRTVFLEAFAQDETELLESINSLPMSVLWSLDVFETTPPAGVTS